MKKLLLTILLMVLSGTAWAAGGGNENLDSVHIKLDDQASLQKGAALFANYCLSCHSLKYMRFNRMAEDLNIDEQVLRANFLMPSQKPGDLMTINMSEEDAKAWFGTAPPDLSLIARSRTPAYIYTFLRSFKVDEESFTGWNNDVFKDVAMPHVLYSLQRDKTAEEYDQTVRDITNFLVYAAEPAKLVRYKVGIWVSVFMVIFIVITYLLKKEFWRDIH